MSQSRTIKKFVRLFIQSNNRVLLPRLPFQDAFSLAQNLSGDITKNPKINADIDERPSEKVVFIKKDGKIDSFRGTEDKRKIKHIQKVHNTIIDKNGKSHRWGFLYPNNLYLKFIKIKDLKDLQKFVEKNEFCIFPSMKESRDLLLEYEKAGFKNPPEFTVFQNKNLAKDKQSDEAKTIFNINLKYILEKKEELENIVKKYANGSLEYHKLLWINKNMENVSDSFFDASHLSCKEISEGFRSKKARDERSMKEIVGMEKIKDLPIIPAYNIYGHYALCCLELYLDIMRKNKLMICENCGQINRIERGQHSDRKYCTKNENSDCNRETVAKNKARSREK